MDTTNKKPTSPKASGKLASNGVKCAGDNWVHIHEAALSGCALALGLSQLNQAASQLVAGPLDDASGYFADRGLRALAKLCQLYLAESATDKVLNDFLEVHADIVAANRYLIKRSADSGKP